MDLKVFCKKKLLSKSDSCILYQNSIFFSLFLNSELFGAFATCEETSKARSNGSCFADPPLLINTSNFRAIEFTLLDVFKNRKNRHIKPLKVEF